MAKVDMVGELLAGHSESEIMDHLYSLLKGIHKNYAIAVEKSSPEVLYANIGDIALATEILRRIKQKNDDRIAMQESM